MTSLPAVIGVMVMVTACSSSSNSGRAAASASPGGHAASSAAPATASPSPAAEPVPSGYTRVGTATQGVSIAAPSKWAAINPTAQAIQEIEKEFHVSGISSSQMTQDIQSLEKLHGIILVDVQSIDATATHYATTLNLYCTPSGITESGSAGLSFFGQAAQEEFQQMGARDVTQKDVTIGGVPGLQTSYQLSSSDGVIYGSQLEVLPKSGRSCFVTLSGVKGEFPVNVLAVAAATAQFP